MQGVLTSAGLCCESGNVDECGICDGLSACLTTGIVHIDAAARKRSLLQPLAALPTGFAATLCDAVGRAGMCGTVAAAVETSNSTTTTVRSSGPGLNTVRLLFVSLDLENFRVPLIEQRFELLHLILRVSIETTNSLTM